MGSFLFNQLDLEQPYQLIQDVLPTKNECLRYVLSRTSNKLISHTTAVRDLTKEVHALWNRGQCCPKELRHLTSSFEKDVWKKYTVAQKRFTKAHPNFKDTRECRSGPILQFCNDGIKNVVPSCCGTSSQKA